MSENKKTEDMNSKAAELMQNEDHDEIKKSIKNGSFYTIKKTREPNGSCVLDSYYHKFVNFVCKHATEKTLKWMIQENIVYTNDDVNYHVLMSAIVSNGRIDLLESFYPEPLDAEKIVALLRVFGSTNLDLFKWFFQKFPTTTCINQPIKTPLHCDETYREQNCDILLTFTRKEAIPVFIWLYENEHAKEITNKHLLSCTEICETEEDQALAIQFFEWVLDVKPDIDAQEAVLISAVSNNRLEIVKWIYFSEKNYSKFGWRGFHHPRANKEAKHFNPITAAVYTENLEMMNWIYANCKEKTISKTMMSVLIGGFVKNGNINLLNWLLHRYGPTPFKTSRFRCGRRNDVAAWFEANNLKLTIIA